MAPAYVPRFFRGSPPNVAGTGGKGRDEHALLAAAKAEATSAGDFAAALALDTQMRNGHYEAVTVAGKARGGAASHAWRPISKPRSGRRAAGHCVVCGNRDTAALKPSGWCYARATHRKAGYSDVLKLTLWRYYT